MAPILVKNGEDFLKTLFKNDYFLMERDDSLKSVGFVVRGAAAPRAPMIGCRCTEVIYVPLLLMLPWLLALVLVALPLLEAWLLLLGLELLEVLFGS